MTENATKKIAANAVVAALYFVLTIALGSLSYQAIQFRIAECLMLLCFFRKDFTWGLTIGCFLANLASPVGWPDWVFGTLATFLSCIFISYLSPRMLIAAVWPVVFNALIVGAELTFVFGDFFYLNAIYVALGELAVLAAGYVLFLLLMRNKAFMAAVKPTIHLSAKW